MCASSARQARARTQRILLLEANPSRDQYTCRVLGASDREYVVNLSATSTSCSCPDHRIRGNRCKHLYFVIHRVLGLDREEEGVYESDAHTLWTRMCESGMPLLERARSSSSSSSSSLPRRSSRRRTKHDACEESPSDLSEECPICMSPFREERLYAQCGGCHNFFHHSCALRWYARCKLCALCRHPMFGKN